MSNAKKKQKIDLHLSNQGGLYLFRARSARAQQFAEDCIELEPYQWIGDGFVVDGRYGDELVAPLLEEGFVITGTE